MGCRITRAGYSSLGTVTLLLGVVVAGLASVAIQLDGAAWIAVAVVAVIAAVALFWASVRLLLRGRLTPPEPQQGPAGTESRHPSS